MLLTEKQNWRQKEDTSDVITRLYTLNRELRQLHQLFTSLKTLVARIIDDKGVPPMTNEDEPSYAKSATEPSEPQPQPQPQLEPRLFKKARDRFERLRDRLQNLMLDTIDDYLKETESLQHTVSLSSACGPPIVTILMQISHDSTSTSSTRKTRRPWRA